jgi:hypothetical protein
MSRLPRRRVSEADNNRRLAQCRLQLAIVSRTPSPAVIYTKLRKALLIFANVGARALCPYLIGPPYVFAMDVPLEFTQDESGSASFGISHA